MIRVELSEGGRTVTLASDGGDSAAEVQRLAMDAWRQMSDCPPPPATGATPDGDPSTHAGALGFVTTENIAPLHVPPHPTVELHHRPGDPATTITGE